MHAHYEDGTVSVILPAYNAAPYIRHTLRSVLEQTYPHLEVLVVDDGSTDETASIIEEFAARDARVRLFRQANMGVGAARNTAIRNAGGSFIAPIDADDVWRPEKLEKQVARMHERGPNTGMVYCWSRSINSDGHVIGHSQPYTIEGGVPVAMLLRNFMGNASVPLFRASALTARAPYLSRVEQGGGQGFEDWDLTLRISEKYDVGVVKDYLVEYRESAECMSADARSMATSFEVVIRRARERNQHIPSRHFRWSAGNFYYYLTRKSFKWHRYSASLRCLCKAVFSDPLVLTNVQTYRMLSHISLCGLTMGRVKHKRYDGSLGPSPTRSTGAPRSMGTKLPPGQRTFDRIQMRRWSAVLANATWPVE